VVELVDKVSKPCLRVANAATPTLNERVLCHQADDDSWVFWWPWRQPIGSVDDLPMVVSKVAEVLRSVQGALAARRRTPRTVPRKSCKS
jgi:hypothetical protein